MHNALLTTLAPLVGALSFFAQPTYAQEGASAPAAAPTIAGWQELLDGLRDLPARMLAKLPADMQQDPQIQQEVGRLALEAFTSSALDALAGDPDYPVFFPQIGQVLNVGQPNADTVYRSARVAPDGTYRMRGHLGSLRMAFMAQAPAMPGEPGFKQGAMPPNGRPQLDLNKLHVDAHGNFDVLISAKRPDGYKGDFWELNPYATRLLLRMVKGDWVKEKDMTLAIERLDKPASRPRPAAAALEQRLRMLPKAANMMAMMFVDHVDQLRREGYVNKLKIFDVSAIGGLAGQFYYEGTYDLKDDEALIVETKVPAKCLYRSLILTNEIYETTDWYNNHSSLNDSQAKPDKDGVLRIVVANKDPGVPNWLDTAGHSTGIIQGRWFECSETPVPTMRKVALADLRKSLPPETSTVTPEQRDRIVRDRRLQYQHRPLW